MPIRPGVAPIAWSNDDLPEPGGDTPLLRLGSGGSRTGSGESESVAVFTNGARASFAGA